jgi:hypothetical protein
MAEEEAKVRWSLMGAVGSAAFDEQLVEDFVSLN